MRGRISQVTVSVSDSQRQELEALLRRQKTPGGLAKRARGILLLSSGERYAHVSERIGLGERHLRKWARRFIAAGVEGLKDRPRPGRAPVIPPLSQSLPGEDGL